MPLSVPTGMEEESGRLDIARTGEFVHATVPIFVDPQDLHAELVAVLSLPCLLRVKMVWLDMEWP